MHPSRVIRGRASQLLAGRRIVVGVSASIAAVELPRVIRELIRHGADVRAVMSPDAAKVVTVEALQFATGHPPVTALTGDVEHVTLLGPGEGQADLLLIAPATANTIGKIAHGIDDTPVTSCASVALGGGVPILLAPAMHADMNRNPAVRENLERLASWGVGLIAPSSAEGEAKIATPEEVAASVLHRLARGAWVGRPVVVIGGAGRERIDDVRSVTNESSGAMAVALATQAHFRGAAVELWLGAVEVPVPPFLPTRRWRSLQELRRLLSGRPGLPREVAAVWVPAALPDFTLRARPGKIPSHEEGPLTIQLERAPKLLPEVRRRAPPPTLLVGFKLESGLPERELLKSAERLRKEVGLDFVVANDRSSMGRSETRLALLSAGGEPLRLTGPKRDVAGVLLEEVGKSLRPGRNGRAHRPGTRSGRERGPTRSGAAGR